MEKYFDRQQAGKVLATRLHAYKNKADVIVLALPRGGVPVAYEIAKVLAAPLDVFLVRKLGVPGQEELAFGAIASGGARVFNEEMRDYFRISPATLDQIIESEQQELQRREIVYRGTRPWPVLANKIILLIDDGIATGATMRVAIQALQQKQPAEIIVAVPVAPEEVLVELTPLVQKIVCPLKPGSFYSVGLWYEDFSQTTDEEVQELLAKANKYI